MSSIEPIMPATEATSGFRELWASRKLRRPDPVNDPYFDWFVANYPRLQADNLLIEAANPFAAPTETIIEIGRFRLEQCSRTGYVFANPRLSTAAAKNFFDQFMGAYFEEVEATFAKRRALSYLELGQRLASIFPKGARLLEVGCGSGALMQVLRTEFGFDVEGCEISAAARPYHERRGQRMHEIAIEDMPGESCYDGVLLWSVADHFSDPAAAFAACRRLLRPGGTLLIANVNIDGFDISTIGTDSLVFAPPGRVNFFNLVALRLLLEMAGLRVEEQTTVGKLDVAIVADYWREGGQNGRTPFLVRLLLDPAQDTARAAFQDFLARNTLSGFQVVKASRR